MRLVYRRCSRMGHGERGRDTEVAEGQGIKEGIGIQEVQEGIH